MGDKRHDCLLRLPEVMNRTGLSRVTIYRRERAGTFPHRVQIGVNAVAWYESDIGDWVANPMSYQQAA